MAGISYKLDDSVAWIGLDRPAKRNAIDLPMLHELDAAIRRAQDEARVLVLSGSGPCFCAGLDLAEHGLRGPEEAFHHSREWHRVFTGSASGRH